MRYGLRSTYDVTPAKATLFCIRHTNPTFPMYTVDQYLVIFALVLIAGILDLLRMVCHKMGCVGLGWVARTDANIFPMS
jgi:hypothetical protein